MNPKQAISAPGTGLRAPIERQDTLGGVGSGKTRISAEYYVRSEKPKDVCHHHSPQARLPGLKEEFAWFAIGKTPESTVGGILTVDRGTTSRSIGTSRMRSSYSTSSVWSVRVRWVKAFPDIAGRIAGSC